MDKKYEVTITAIGNLAKTFLQNNKSIILLDEGVRPNLADMVVEHSIGTLVEDIAVGDKLVIGKDEFSVVKVGDVVNDTIKEEGHCTVVFNGEGSMPGQIIVKGPTQPQIRVGAAIYFMKK